MVDPESEECISLFPLISEEKTIKFLNHLYAIMEFIFLSDVIFYICINTLPSLYLYTING